MFISPGNLKKQLKKSYTGGVHIGSIFDGLVISQGHFIVWIQYDKVPNEIKAIVAEFLGIIPGKNEGMFSARKDVPYAQSELASNYESFLEGVRHCKCETVKTKIVIESSYQDAELFQNKDFDTIFGINVDYLALFDPTKCDSENGETSPNNTPYTSNDNKMFYWVNDACKLIVLPVDFRANKTFLAIKDALEKIDFEEVN